MSAGPGEREKLLREPYLECSIAAGLTPFMIQYQTNMMATFFHKSGQPKV